MASSSIDHAFTAETSRSAAGDPTYAGALSFMRRSFTKDVAGADAIVWGVPFDAAVSNRPGARFGPQAIRRASSIFDNDPQYPFNDDLFSAMAVVDYGDCLWDYRRPEDAHAAIQAEAEKLLESGAYLLSLGGDHSITWPLLNAHVKRHNKLALLQFDAHQDTWPVAGNRVDHGSFVKAAVESGLIDPDISLQIGIRTVAPEECGIAMIGGLELDEMSSVDVAEQIYQRMGGSQVYLTFDIDCLDPAHAPGTGTPVSGGPSSAKILNILRHLKNLQIVGSDVVEVAPAYDHADITAIAGSTVAMYMLGLLAGRQRAAA